MNDFAVKSAKPGPKPIKLPDGHGMHLEISPAGGKWWRLRYRHKGVAKSLSLGTYPLTSLKEAREKRDEYRKLISQGINPSDQRPTALVYGRSANV